MAANIAVSRGTRSSKRRACVSSPWKARCTIQSEETHALRFDDLVPRETAMFAAMIAALIAIGFYPQPLITTGRQTVTSVQQITAGSRLTPQATNAAQVSVPAAGAPQEAGAAGGEE